jgi:hypothetical protein
MAVNNSDDAYMRMARDHCPGDQSPGALARYWLRTHIHAGLMFAAKGRSKPAEHSGIEE